MKSSALVEHGLAATQKGESGEASDAAAQALSPADSDDATDESRSDIATDGMPAAAAAAAVTTGCSQHRKGSREEGCCQERHVSKGEERRGSRDQRHDYRTSEISSCISEQGSPPLTSPWPPLGLTQTPPPPAVPSPQLVSTDLYVSMAQLISENLAPLLAEVVRGAIRSECGNLAEMISAARASEGTLNSAAFLRESSFLKREESQETGEDDTQKIRQLPQATSEKDSQRNRPSLCSSGAKIPGAPRRKSLSNIVQAARLVQSYCVPWERGSSSEPRQVSGYSSSRSETRGEAARRSSHLANLNTGNRKSLIAQPQVRDIEDALANRLLAAENLVSQDSGDPAGFVRQPIRSSRCSTISKAPVWKLQVTIAHGTGLKLLNLAGDTVACTCEVKHSVEKKLQPSRFETKAVSNMPDQVIWQETHEVEDWSVGDPLEFSVLDRGAASTLKTPSGTVLVPSGNFFPNGFEGDVAIAAGGASLHVQIVPKASRGGGPADPEAARESLSAASKPVDEENSVDRRHKAPCGTGCSSSSGLLEGKENEAVHLQMPPGFIVDPGSGLNALGRSDNPQTEDSSNSSEQGLKSFIITGSMKNTEDSSTSSEEGLGSFVVTPNMANTEVPRPTSGRRRVSCTVIPEVPSSMSSMVSISSVTRGSCGRATPRLSSVCGVEAVRQLRTLELTQCLTRSLTKSIEVDEEEEMDGDDVSNGTSPCGAILTSASFRSFVTPGTSIKTAHAIEAPMLTVVCGILPPILESSGCTPPPLWQRPAVWYQWLVLFAAVASLGKTAVVMSVADSGCDDCPMPGLLSDLPLAFGGVCGLLLLGTPLGSANLCQNVALLVSYAQRAGFYDSWVARSRRDMIVCCATWLLSCLCRAWSDGLLFAWPGGSRPESPYCWLRVVTFTVCSGLVIGLSFCLLHICRALAVMVDTFCFNILNDTALTDAVREWNTLQAVLRKASSSVERCFFNLQATASFAVLLCVADVVRDARSEPEGALFLTRLVPVMLVACSVVSIFFRAAAVTDKCARVPSLVNSFGHDMDTGRQYVVEYIINSAAGFYVFEVRLTQAMALKFTYLCGVILLGLATDSMSWL